MRRQGADARAKATLGSPRKPLDPLTGSASLLGALGSLIARKFSLLWPPGNSVGKRLNFLPKAGGGRFGYLEPEIDKFPRLPPPPNPCYFQSAERAPTINGGAPPFRTREKISKTSFIRWSIAELLCKPSAFRSKARNSRTSNMDVRFVPEADITFSFSRSRHLTASTSGG